MHKMVAAAINVVSLVIGFYTIPSAWGYDHRPEYYRRRHDPIVNTRVEERHDANHDGIIEPNERARMRHDAYCHHHPRQCF